MRKSYWIPLLLVGITLIAFFLRFYGITHNNPFWVDEFSTAAQAQLFLRYGLGVFTNPNIFFEPHNITTHIMVAFFFKVFGFHEYAARLPFVIIGSLLPVFVFLVAKQLFDKRTAAIAALFTTFSYIEVTWSRQARDYVLIEFLVLVLLYLYNKILAKMKLNILEIVIFLGTIAVGILSHPLFLIFLLVILMHWLYTERRILKNPIFYFFLVALVLIMQRTGLLLAVINSYKSGFLKANNLWYYHSFLWREYGLITFIALCGLLMALKSNLKLTLLPFIYIILQLVFISFFFAPYTSRYLLPIFPFLFIFMAYAISYLTEIFCRFQKIKHANLIAILIALFIIGSGYKFVNKPKSFYSVNHDFREIAIIDYHEIYNIIKTAVAGSKEPVAIIETWPARVYWYLGLDYQPTYFFHWINEEGTVNGLGKQTNFVLNKNGDKIIPRTNNLILIGNLTDFKKVMSLYPRGFIFIDDSSLPQDVINFANTHLKKELYLDHYPLDDNPYSIWPATLYSWGIH